MNRLFRVLHRWKCKTASQKLALDALRHLDADGRAAGLFLWHVEPYLRGVDAPEAEFRDFTNHVLYPVENWGGAARLARKWYWKTVEALRSGDWPDAAFSAGVMTRYVTFAFMPTRAGHDVRALTFRRPLECCLSRLYDDLTASPADAPEAVRTPDGEDWLERLVTAAAEDAYCHLRTVTARFDFDAVIANPAALDDELKAIFADLLARSAATAGAILGRAVAESGAELPRRWLGPAGLLALPSLPLFWLTRSQAQAAERRAVRTMHREFTATGTVEEALPEDAKAIRDAYELEVLKKAPRTKGSAPPSPASQARSASEGHGRSASLQRLSAELRRDAPKQAPVPRPTITPSPSHPLVLSSPIDAAPSIDSKLLARLESAGIVTVADLLATDPEDLASALHPAASATDVAGWQDQARLSCAVVSLTPAEAQLLVACGVTGPEDLAALSPVELWELVVPVAESPDGRRLLRGGVPPDLNAVTRWIDAAKRPRKAA